MAESSEVTETQEHKRASQWLNISVLPWSVFLGLVCSCVYVSLCVCMSLSVCVCVCVCVCVEGGLMRSPDFTAGANPNPNTHSNSHPHWCPAAVVTVICGLQVNCGNKMRSCSMMRLWKTSSVLRSDPLCFHSTNKEFTTKYQQTS